MKILTNRTTNGTSAAVTYNPFKKNSAAGGPVSSVVAIIATAGVFGGASIALEASPDQGTTWITDTFAITAPAFTSVYLMPGWQIRLVVSSASGTTNINAWIDSESSIIPV